MCRLLIVDDNQDGADSLALLLKATMNQGVPMICDLRKAYSAEEAIRVMEEVPADVVLMDVVMPGTDGWTLGKRFKEQYGCAVIILSGLADQNAHSRSHKQGFRFHITKPADPHQLTHLIIEMCRFIHFQKEV